MGKLSVTCTVALSAIFLIMAFVMYPAERQKALDAIVHEHEALCTKFGLVFGSPEHTGCMVDLMQLRERALQEASDSLI